MRFLRQNTAVLVTVGPMTNYLTGVVMNTATETGITGVMAYDDDDGTAGGHFDFTCSAYGGDNDLVAVGHNGLWTLELTAAQTNFTGRAKLSLSDDDQIGPMWEDFQVLTANVYDSLFAGSGPTADLLDVNLSQWLGTAAHAATVAGVPVVQLHDSAGAGGINAPANFEDLNITDTTGLVRPDMANASGNYSGTVATVTTLTNWGGEVDVTKIHGSALTETSSGYLAAAFTKQYDVATPVFTAASVNQTGDAYANLDIAALKAEHGIAPTSTLYFIRPAASGGNDSNNGLSPSAPKLEPGNITLADGDGVCVIGVCPITVAFNPSTVAKLNIKLFGFGTGLSRLTSTTIAYDGEATPPTGEPMVRLNGGCRVIGLQIAGNAAGVIPLAQSSVGAIYDCVVKDCCIIGNQIGFFQRETEDNYTHVYETLFDNVVFRAVNPVYLISGNGMNRFVGCTMRSSVTTAATGDTKRAAIRFGKVDSNNWGGRCILDRCHLVSEISSATVPAYGIYVGAMYATTATANGDVGYGRIIINGGTMKVYNPLAGGAADIQNDDTAGRTKVIIGPCDGPLVTAGTGDIEYAQPGKDILEDTAELQADWANGGRLDLILDDKATATNVTDSQGVVTTALGNLQTHGDSTWSTATGFSTHDAADVAALILDTPANPIVTDANGFVTYANAAPPAMIEVSEIVSGMQDAGTYLKALYDVKPASAPPTKTEFDDALPANFALLAIDEDGKADANASIVLTEENISDIADAAADAVLDEALSGHTTTGTAGKALTDIKAKTDALGAASVTLQSPVATDGTVTLIRGDDYTVATSRQITLTFTNYTGPDLDGETGYFRASAYDEDATTVAAELEVEADLTQAGSIVTAVIEITSADTASLTTSPPSDWGVCCEYQCGVEDLAVGEDTADITLGTGRLNIIRDIEAVT